MDQPLVARKRRRYPASPRRRRHHTTGLNSLVTAEWLVRVLTLWLLASFLIGLGVMTGAWVLAGKAELQPPVVAGWGTVETAVLALMAYYGRRLSN